MERDEREIRPACCCGETTETVENGEGGERIELSEKKKVRTEEEKRALTSRLHRIVGQLNGIEKMVESNRYCGDILLQLTAVEKSVKSLSAMILEKHLHTCIVENIQRGNTAVVDELVDLFGRYV